MDNAQAVEELYDQVYKYTKVKVIEWYSQPDILTGIFERIPISGEDHAI